jgi:uncharacterized repeat protein (TIGR03803 family)
MRLNRAIVLSCLVACPACSQTGVTPSSLPAAATFGQQSNAGATYKAVYSFKGSPDGDTPNGDLIYMGDAFYGTTSTGGTSDLGTLFKLLPSGRETSLYSFVGGSGGNTPDSGVIALHGTFYGTTSDVAYQVTAAGKEMGLHTFGSGNDGATTVQSPMAVLNGELYGATQLGGSKRCNSGCGTIFGLTTGGAENVVYAFQGGHDGDVPLGSVIDVKGELYGTTSYGGSNDGGTVFKMTTSGTKTTLYSFKGGSSDGERPSGNLINVDGVLYGTTGFGGKNDLGTVFALASGKETVLHAFTGAPDGASPNGSLLDVKGTLYGTTSGGGKFGKGTVFSVSKSGKEQILYAFKGGSGGYLPLAGLVSVKGTLYGTTDRGGGADKGTVYSIKP